MSDSPKAVNVACARLFNTINQMLGALNEDEKLTVCSNLLAFHVTNHCAGHGVEVVGAALESIFDGIMNTIICNCTGNNPVPTINEILAANPSN